MTFLTINAHNDRMEMRGREREKGGLKLLYKLIEKSKNFSNPNFNKPIHISGPMVQSEAPQ
jgi:hypothetical protein